MSGLVLLGVPTSAGSHHAGQELAPAALRAAGLLRRLHLAGVDVEDAGDLPGVVWTQAAPDDTARHVEAVAAVARGVADAVEREVARGRVPVVLGGDCTITLGVVAGVQRGAVSTGLAYLDGDADLSTPETTDSGVLDAMGIAHLLGLADDALARVGSAYPMLGREEVVLLGYDPGDLGEQGRELLAGLSGLRAVAYEQLAEAPARHVAEALAALGQERLVVHFDVDAVDGRDLALANFPHYGTGVPLAVAGTVLTALVEDRRVAAVVLTEVNPTHDPSGVLLERYVDTVVGALAHSSRHHVS